LLVGKVVGRWCWDLGGVWGVYMFGLIKVLLTWAFVWAGFPIARAGFVLHCATWFA
jgi:hypothetical protein